MKSSVCIWVLFYFINSVWTIPFDDRLFGALFKNMDDDEAVLGNEKPMTEFRLPDDLIPKSYNVHLKPHLEEKYFEGKVNITFTVQKSTQQVVLNSKFITINETDSHAITIYQINTKRPVAISVDKIEFDHPNQQLVITTAKSLVSKSTYVISISYRGLLAKDMMGFYLSTYQNNGVKKYLASTQFEPTGARRAFPCFDEPRFKTPFTIHITRKDNQKSISNMPLRISSKSTNGLVVDEFKTSPPMPTYLVGFAVFEFDNVSNDNGTFRVWGRENIIKEQGKYILDIGPKILEELGKYFNRSYYTMLPKMDLVAVPDFDAGAMENWGMNTYREILLLLKASETPTVDLQRATTVITHEFSHQWFGDLVTPVSWDYTWLNEGFARFFQYFGTSLVKPTWRMEDLFVVEQVQVAFNSDLKNSHAMTSETTTPDSIADTFDHIIYNKGGSVLRMLENVLSPEIFRKGLQRHLTNGYDIHEGSVEPALLWQAINEVLGEQNTKPQLPEDDVETFMYEWVNKPGYPLVTAKCNYTTGNVSLTQERFFANKSDGLSNETTWYIPITYTEKTGADFSPSKNIVWLNKENPLVIKKTDKSDWLIVNLKEIGFYRVNYDNDNWDLLAKQLSEKHSAIHVLNRAQLFDDAFTLAQTGRLNYSYALNLLKYLDNEVDFIPWYSLWSHVRYLMVTFSDKDFAGTIQAFINSKLDGIFTNLGASDSENEDIVNQIGRSRVFLWKCSLGCSKCKNIVNPMFRNFIADPQKNRIPPNMKDAAFCTGIKEGSASDWEKLWSYYMKTELASEKIAILDALGCSQNESVLYNYLLKIKDELSGVRIQDQYIVIRSVLGEKAGVQAGLKFLDTQIPAMIKEAKADKFSPALDNVKSIISRIGVGISDSKLLKQFEDLHAKYKDEKVLTNCFNRTLNRIKERFDFTSKHSSTLLYWFTKNAPPPTTTIKPSPTDAPGPNPVTSSPKPSSATSIFSSITTVMGCFATLLSVHLISIVQ